MANTDFGLTSKDFNEYWGYIRPYEPRRTFDIQTGGEGIRIWREYFESFRTSSGDEFWRKMKDEENEDGIFQ